MHSPLVVGNWKLNGTKLMVLNLIKNLCIELADVKNCNIVIAPPMVYLDQASKCIYGSNIMLGAQNVDIHLFGAFTGETSVNMLIDMNVKYVIIGHSERRNFHNENNKIIAKKYEILKKANLIPIFCIGETFEEKMSGKTKEVCVKQIDVILKTQGIEAFQNAVIAYEPIWAIGTGNSANAEQIQEIHKFIRNHIAEKDALIAKQVIIQYGGSVTNNNAIELFRKKDVDGALIGLASLKADIFSMIVKTAASIKDIKSKKY